MKIWLNLVEDTLTDTGCGSETDPLGTKGFHWPGDKYRIHVLSCGNEVRDELNTDWATVIFVPYTATQVDGLAFGFTEGAFIQDRYMTTVNGGGVIPAHEWTHMVGTTDMIECDFVWDLNMRHVVKKLVTSTWKKQIQFP